VTDVLVCCDNEGCIVDAKGRAFDLPALHELADAISRFPGTFTVCTGRSVPYIEAIVQALGLTDSDVPCVCEGGAAFYLPNRDRYEVLAGAVDAAAVRALLPAGSYREELGKVACYTAYPEPGWTVDQLYDFVRAGALDGVEVNVSTASIDVTPKGVDKMSGVVHLLARLNTGWSSVLAIGDSWNDLPMIRAAGLSACPSNAVREVQEAVDYVSPHPASRGVVDILRWARERAGS
jgi:hydroxymethylpyrimidine pyrophosphatase-like HAD family hydrolase